MSWTLVVEHTLECGGPSVASLSIGILLHACGVVILFNFHFLSFLHLWHVLFCSELFSTCSDNILLIVIHHVASKKGPNLIQVMTAIETNLVTEFFLRVLILSGCAWGTMVSQHHILLKPGLWCTASPIALVA